MKENILDLIKAEAMRADANVDSVKYKDNVSREYLAGAEGYARGLWKAYHMLDRALHEEKNAKDS